MGAYLGNTEIGQMFLGSTEIGQAYLGSVKVFESTPPDPYNPLNLPPYTIRVRSAEGTSPLFPKGTPEYVSPNVFDLTYENSDWTDLLNRMNVNLLEVLGANTSSVTTMTRMLSENSALTSVALFDTRSVTDMSNMMYACSGLTTVPLFDTSSVLCMDYMLQSCSSLTAIPLFNTSSVTSMNGTFDGCRNVTTGALALYTQASSQAVPPQYHRYCFWSCGSNTTSGAAELAQIPSDWK